MTTARTSSTRTPAFAVLDWVRVLGGARHALIDHGLLHGQLVGIELEQEKRRLVRVLLLAVVGVSALTCTLLCVGALVLALTWYTPYRVLALLAMLMAYGGSTFAMWMSIRSAVNEGGQGFSASIEELAADAALLRPSP